MKLIKINKNSACFEENKLRNGYNISRQHHLYGDNAPHEWAAFYTDWHGTVQIIDQFLTYNQAIHTCYEHSKLAQEV